MIEYKISGREVNEMKRFLCLLILALSVFIFAACGVGGDDLYVPSASLESAPTETPKPTPTPVPTPIPTREPELPTGQAVTVDGYELQSGSVIANDTEYMMLYETAKALKLDTVEEGDKQSFVWRRKNVSFEVGSDIITYGDKTATLSAPVIRYHEDVWVPIESFCDALDIGVLVDTEYLHIYCTPGAGNWELKEGYRVPICMYHAVCEELFEYMLYDMCVRPSEMEEQLIYLRDNGYDTLFFEDLEHIEEYEKPVILTFDDGYDCLYTELFPLLKKYNAKAVVYLITNNVVSGAYHSLSADQILEMHASGLVSFQSHTASHDYLIYHNEEEQAEEHYSSKLFITRLVGQEPFAMAYPYGSAYEGSTTAVAMDYYRFGVRMGTFPYYTGDDPSFMYRLNITRDMPIFIYEHLLELEDPARATS